MNTRNGSHATNRSKASIPNANSREASERFAETPREAEIASDLDISVKRRVEKHRQHLMEKLHIHDIAGLNRYAIAAGVIESSVHQTIA